MKAEWGKLTDDDLTMLDGKKDTLIGKIQERYGIKRDEAERRVDDWSNRVFEEKEEPVGRRGY